MNIQNFNQLKNNLQVGTILTLSDTSMVNHKKLNIPRAIAKKQTNAIMFEDKSWLYWGKSSEYTFFDNGFTYKYPDTLSRDGSGDIIKGDYLTYTYN